MLGQGLQDVWRTPDPAPLAAGTHTRNTLDSTHEHPDCHIDRVWRRRMSATREMHKCFTDLRRFAETMHGRQPCADARDRRGESLEGNVAPDAAPGKNHSMLVGENDAFGIHRGQDGRLESPWVFIGDDSPLKGLLHENALETTVSPVVLAKARRHPAGFGRFV